MKLVKESKILFLTLLVIWGCSTDKSKIERFGKFYANSIFYEELLLPNRKKLNDKLIYVADSLNIDIKEFNEYLEKSKFSLNEFELFFEVAQKEIDSLKKEHLGK